MIRAGVGTSREPDPMNAGFEACAEAMRVGGVEAPNVTLVFASSLFDQESVLAGVRKANGETPTAGCSSSGEITGEGPSRQSVVVMAIESDTLTCLTSAGRNIKEGPAEAGAAFGRGLKPADGLSACLIFPDVLVGNGTATLEGAQKVLGEHVPVFGGAAGDDFRFERTFQYCDAEVLSGGLVGIGLYGVRAMGAGVRHGWMPIGLPMKVTRSAGSVLHELDGGPAVKIYEDYFGEHIVRLREEPLARLAITYPLGIQQEATTNEFLIRDPITVNEDGSITCAAEVPEGAEVRLMIGSHENAIEAAEAAAHKLMQDFKAAGAKPRALFIFNCIAREKLMGARAGEEIETVMRIIGQEVPTIGFYTYGEIAPPNGDLSDKVQIRSRFFNETIVLFAIGD